MFLRAAMGSCCGTDFASGNPGRAVVPVAPEASPDTKLVVGGTSRITCIGRKHLRISLMIARSGLFRVTRGWSTMQGDVQPGRHFEKAPRRRGQGCGGILK